MTLVVSTHKSAAFFEVSTVIVTGELHAIFSLCFPGGLVARIPRFHRRSSVSIPGQGTSFQLTV